MKKWILKDEVKRQIKSNADLFRDLCKALDISPYTLPDLLRKDDAQLTQKEVLVIISNTLDIPENKLLEKTVNETV